MLPYVDEAERERHERRLERDRRRRDQGKQAYFESETDSGRRRTRTDPPTRVLAGLEAEAFDAEGLATQPAGIAPPAVAQESPDSATGSRARASSSPLRPAFHA